MGTDEEVSSISSSRYRILQVHMFAQRSTADLRPDEISECAVIEPYRARGRDLLRDSHETKKRVPAGGALFTLQELNKEPFG